jgi:parvulin-like peptidyl-prolyl isomerase
MKQNRIRNRVRGGEEQEQGSTVEENRVKGQGSRIKREEAWGDSKVASAGNGLATVVFLGIILFAAVAMSASGDNLPVVRGKKTVALVNGEPITLADFNYALGALHAEVGDGKRVGAENRSKLLDRLIDTRLVVQEARKIGLDGLPEVKNMVDLFARVTLRQELMDRQVRNLKAPDKDVERRYRDAVKEWKISSVVFDKEDGAKKMSEELKGGKTFEDLSRDAVATGSAKAGEEGQYLKPKEAIPEVAAVVSGMQPGSVSPVIPTKSGFVLIRLEDLRYGDSPEAMARARSEALRDARMEALKAYSATLIKRYATIHKEVLDRIDFEAKEPGFQKFLKDRRVVAEIRGEKPITVGELAEQLRQQLYHGVEQAAESKKINAKKVPTLDEMLYKRVFRKEALRLGLDKTERYKGAVKEYETSVVFGAFVQKAVVPDVKLNEEQVKAYYQTHMAEYMLPEMMRISSLAFEKRADAEAGIEKLRKGTDFQWLSAHAEGQVDKKSNGLLVFEGALLTTADLPEGMRKVISGAKAGDLKLYASPEGYFYALSIQQVVASTPKPYEEAREEIAKKLFNEKLKQAMGEWTAKLRAASEIKVYLRQ